MASWVSSAVWAAASCVGSVVVEKLVDMGLNSIKSKRTLQVDSEAALKRVQAALPQIRAVMVVAEALKMEDSSCGEWVHRFREAVDAAEDVIDELEYKKLEDKVQNPSDDQVAGSSFGSKKRKITGAISADILERLKNAVTMLDEATAGAEDLLQRADRLGIRYLSESQFEVRPNLRRETTSLLAEREVFGRDVEKAEIIGWLTRETEAPLSCFGIVGVGGLGKTTLAQSVNRELSGSGYFEKIIWVCVSTEFSVEGITKNILAGMKVKYRGDDSLDVLQQRLKEKIDSSNKVLLILDDVWEDGKRGNWEQLVAPLRFAQKGSKILFTTRQKSVADLLASVVNTKHKSLPLKNLEEEELRKLFKSYAFDGFNPNNYRDLQAIGDQIVTKLHGNPLATKVIGSLLNSRMDSLYWRTISNHKSLINLEQANVVMDVLKLSYYNLPADLQVCFRFCSIFPQDYEFDKDELIEMWMASGFIQKQSCEGRRTEDIGEDYFNLLWKKSFFERFGQIDERNEYRYVMHDLIQKVFHLENIRSLVITTRSTTWRQPYETEPNIFVLPNNLVKKSLRLLKINTHRSYKLPEDMSCLVHLRYLSIELEYYKSQSFKYLLPASLYKLYHLLVLEFKQKSGNSSYSGIETTRMANLVSLRHMRLPDEIMKTIRGVHRMTSLQGLNFFVGNESGYRINELSTLNNLRRLTIHNIENIVDPAEATSANLLAKKNLESLTLKCTKGSNLDNPEQIFDNLRPHQNLMELRIWNYKGRKSPIWIRDMPYLKILDISWCENPVQLLDGPFRLPEFIPFVVKTPISSSIESYLRKVKITNCPNIQNILSNGLPCLPLSLIKFSIEGIAISALPEYFESPSSSGGPSPLREVCISYCPNLTALNGFLQQDNINFRAIKKIEIRQCENLVRIPMGAFGKFESLTYLAVIDCPKLVAVDKQNNLLPSKLKELIFGNCGELDVPLLESSSRLTTLTSLGIINSANITHIPFTENAFGSLYYLEIRGCPKLIELSLMQQDNIDFRAIHTIYIAQCENLVRIPMGGFWKFESLTDLVIQDCPKLVAVDNQSNLLPSKLKELIIENCGELDVSLLESSSRLTTLTHLQIINSANITHIPSIENVFGSLHLLIIRGCPKLIELSLMQQDNIDLRIICIAQCENLVRIPMGAFGKFESLTDLAVIDCPKLVAVDNQDNLLPSKLKELIFGNCGELDVPLLESSSRLTTLTSLGIRNSANITHIPFAEKAFGSLYSLEIRGCLKLIELSLMQQDNIDFRAIQTIYIAQCENLVRILMRGFWKFESLIDLVIQDCPKLVAIDNQSNLLPSKLKKLIFGNCGELDVALLELSSRLTTLTSLGIINSANITHIPFAENAFGSLYSLVIGGCPKLIELSLMQQAHSVDRGISVASLKIKTLSIDQLSLLLIEPLRSLRYVSDLQVSNCSEMDALPEQWLLQNSSTLRRLEIENASTLQSLPATMVRLTALEELKIQHADSLMEPPDLPTTLKVRTIKSSDGADKF